MGKIVTKLLQNKEMNRDRDIIFYKRYGLVKKIIEQHKDIKLKLV